MAKRRGSSKKTSKKTLKKSSKKAPKKVVKKSSQKANKSKLAYKTRDSLNAKKQRIFVNFIRFFVFFVICLVLYFVTTNYVLWVLFGIGAIIGGAVSLALLLVMVGFLLTKKKR